jgi:putative ABC transport system permease protein
VRALVRRDRLDRDLEDELQHYLDLSIEEHVRAGLPRREAERLARAQLGSIAAAKDEIRSSTWEAALDAIWRDAQYALRGLRRNSGFTLIAVSTLALGVGATTAMFTVVNAVMLRPLPYLDANRLVLIWTDDVRRGLHHEPTAFRTISDWTERSHAFQEIGYFSTGRAAPMSNDPGVHGRTRQALVSGNLFTLLGVQPLLGRALSQADADSRAPVVVISHAFWQRWFAGAADVVGRTIEMEDPSTGGLGTLTVVGVMPASFYFPDKLTEIWTPATTYWRFARESSERFPSWARRWTAVGRLAPGVSAADARGELARIGEDLASAHPATIDDFPGFRTTVTPVLDSIAGVALQSALWLLLGATALVLLVACANVGNLLLARGMTRRQEFAVRRALGGGRDRLVRQLCTENLVLALTGGAAGTLVAAWGTRGLAVAASAIVPRLDEIAVDGRVLAFAIGVSVVSACLFGLVPAFRLSAVEAEEALKDGYRATAGVRVRRLRGAIVLAECALAVVLLTGAGLLLRSLIRLQAVDPGFDPSGVLAVRVEHAPEAAPTADERTQPSATAAARARGRNEAMNAVLARLRSSPGVESAGAVDDLFVTGQPNHSITIPGRAPIQTGELNQAAATPGFFETMRVPRRRGRALTADDAAQKIRALWSPVVTDLPLAEKERRAVFEPVVVNETFARRFFAGEDPIGKRFCIDPTNKTYWYEIVGVVADMRRQGLERGAIPEYFGPYLPSPNGRVDLVVRTAGDPVALSPTIRREIRRALPSAAVVSVSTATAQLGDFDAQRRLQTWLLSGFAGLALALAGIGIFGLVQYAVAERTHEIGVRLALGATPGAIVSLLVGEGMTMPAMGIVMGLASAALLTRLVEHQLFDVTATDPETFAGGALLLALVALCACYTAARRTTRVDPAEALRRI